jgi:hypothetical protein
LVFQGRVLVYSPGWEFGILLPYLLSYLCECPILSCSCVCVCERERENLKIFLKKTG